MPDQPLPKPSTPTPLPQTLTQKVNGPAGLAANTPPPAPQVSPAAQSSVLPKATVSAASNSGVFSQPTPKSQLPLPQSQPRPFSAPTPPAPPVSPPPAPPSPVTGQPPHKPSVSTQPSMSSQVTQKPPVFSPSPAMTKPPGSLSQSTLPNGSTSGISNAPKPITPIVSTASANASGKMPAATPPKRSLLRFLPLLLLLLLFFGAVGFGIYWFMNRTATDDSLTDDKTDTPVATKTITYWGLWEPNQVMQEVLQDFERQNPGYKVEYLQQSHKEYRERLQAEIASGRGPDVFRYHASWIPMMKDELSMLPEKVMSAQEYQQTFYPVATQALTREGNIVGIPLMYEGLGLYYNKDIFSVANLTPPKNWEEMKITAQALTIRSGEKITRGGIAMGTATNVEHFSEIIGLLMIQNGADLSNPSSPQARTALNFYTDFASQLRVWDSSFPAATVAFGKGDVAMMIAPSWRVHEIRAVSPNIQFDIAPVPQLPNQERITWASFWAEGVSEKSKEKEMSWKLLEYMSQADVQKKLYSQASQIRAFGELYSRVDLREELATQPYVGAYLDDAAYARTGFMNSFTHDQGLNDRVNKYFEDAVNKGRLTDQDFVTLQQGVNQVLQTYGVPVSQPATTQ